MSLFFPSAHLGSKETSGYDHNMVPECKPVIFPAVLKLEGKLGMLVLPRDRMSTHGI